MPCTPRLPVLVLSTLALASGCTSETQSGIVVVEYAFDAGSGCDDLGVVQVRATLRGGMNPSATAPCSVGSGVTIEHVPAGNYGLKVEAIDSAGDTIYDNLGNVGQVPMDQAVEVLGGVSNSYDATLYQTPATVRMTFQIVDEEGFFVQAANAEIKQFEVEARRSTVPMVTHVYDYATAQAKEAMNDPERKIEGDNLSSVRVRPLGASGQNIGGQIDVAIEPSPGHGKAVEIVIDCIETDCTGRITHNGSDLEDDDDPEPDTGGVGTGG